MFSSYSAAREMSKKLAKKTSDKTDGQLRLKKLSEEKLTTAHLPLAYQTKDGKFVVLARLSEDRLIQKADESEPEVISRQDLKQQWAGQTIQYHQSGGKFDISWFIPEFVRHRKLLGEGAVFFTLTSTVSPHPAIIFSSHYGQGPGSQCAIHS